MACTGMMKDIRRTYEYHGAEHKTIACYEAGEELTVENVKKHTRFHPRCGTSFIFITLIVSILVMCIVPVYQVLPRIIVSILLLPLVVGISYEFIRIAGRSSSWLTRALSWPGLQIQRITTYARSDTINRLKPERLQRYAQLKLNRFHIGLETGNDEILKRMRKGVTKQAQIEAGIKAKRRH